MANSGEPRFITLDEVAEELSTTTSQAYALVRHGTLPAIKLGGRGQWRVERLMFEKFLEQMYAETREFVEAHPFGGQGGDSDDSDDRES
ncbi:helix-turn-helix transcriptional regulator [Segeticoccus rhizosphaerae]|uniref:helix-turn-helix transcriptional regulator n=1 Tax=Segeticoccus rhizosphaerae TaxID=1104777 RepID=UPI0010C01885|nr:helix-turn-helix domain-containing protein [Ornithinicoccus soli]